MGAKVGVILFVLSISLIKITIFVKIYLCLVILLIQWFGDAEKLTKALFSFAGKLSPVIIFVDEVGTLFVKSIVTALLWGESSSLGSVEGEE